MTAHFALTFALATSLASPPAASTQISGNATIVGRGSNRSLTGRVLSVFASSFTLDDGYTVLLKSGTPIIGGQIVKGALVAVTGFGTGNRYIRATSVNIIRHPSIAP
jgi:hypothetical protein